MASTVEAPEEWIESVSRLTFPDSTDHRLQVLMDRNTEGLLTAEERQELEALVEMSERLALVRAEALQLLQRKSA